MNVTERSERPDAGWPVADDDIGQEQFDTRVVAELDVNELDELGLERGTAIIYGDKL